jgi:hypothetical protein
MTNSNHTVEPFNDDLDPFCAGGKEKAERFARKFLTRSFCYDRCCIIAEAAANLLRPEHLRHFGQQIDLPARSSTFKMACHIGDCENDIEASGLSRYHVVMGLFAYLDRQELQSVLRAAEPNNKDFRAGMESFIELRRSRERLRVRRFD